MNNLVLRIIGSVFLVIILFIVHIVFFYNAKVLFLASAVITSAMLIELNKLNNNKNNILNYIVLLTNVFFQTMIYYFDFKFLSLYIFLLLIIYTLSLLFMENIDFYDILFCLFKFIYISFLFGHILFFKSSIYIGLIYTISFGTDIFAYAIGTLIGKHKMVPKISPKKSFEGFFGGIIGSTFISVMYIRFFNIEITNILIIIFIVGSIIGQVGDLLASKIKRKFNTKDFGSIIMGHGGVLDRFDSVLLVTPYLYYALTLLSKTNL